MLKKWNDLPDFMKNDEVRPYYDALQKKKISLFFKRFFDIVGGLILLILFLITTFRNQILFLLDLVFKIFIFF